MLADAAVAAFLLVCLGCFVSINLHNILVVHRHRNSEKAYAEVERPSGLVVALAAVGTIVYFLVASLYLLLVLTECTAVLLALSLRFQPLLMFNMQILGLILTGVGYFLFIWSVIVRGWLAVSWAMTKDHRLVTWGPYRYVRHPSYLGYFLMFVGLFFLWPSPLTLFPLMAIPGYLRVTIEEERLLMRRFGDQFLEYQRRTGRFIPRSR